METVLVAEHFSITDAIRNHVNSELKEIEPLLPEESRISVILDETSDRQFQAVFKTRAWNSDLVTKASSSDLYSAVTKAGNLLTQRARKVKDKRITKMRKQRQESEIPVFNPHLLFSEETSLQVKDLMSTDLHTVTSNSTLQDLRELMQWQAIRHVPVVDDTGKVIGLVTQRDVLNLAISKLANIDQKEADEIYSTISVSDIMGRSVATIQPDAPIWEAAKKMTDNRFGCLPVEDASGKLVGIITTSDFVKSFMST